ncbi:uncharacterized protein F4807DRAFT_429759 [Annulohypoxylon truncatum]|uniref:uncharacterized protein n=1 Tax=Annulohypoxylon truncatum TaxID=327061 RepID=UPI002008C3F7|nr:uncharacterized protein F4807DRAFT_429759 [Annulohypoxylon truncatum]KAI1208860.1 hypothetical protein F4807DRAFT_429759 [Annulohypoxylon truncatum]
MQRSQATPSTPSSKSPLNGFFRNGVWHCNCIPRLPAVQFTVRRDTANKGRSFYTCQKDKDKKNKCDFFLWTEDAHEREIGAVLTNSRSEAEGTPSHKPKRQRTLHESITPAKEKRPEGEKTPVTSISELNRMLGRNQNGESAVSSATLQSETVRGSPSISKTPVNNTGGLFSSDEDSDEMDEIFKELSEKPVPSATHGTPSAGSKRKRPEVDDYSDFSSGDEEVLATIADNSAKAQTRHRDACETPSANRTLVAEDGLPTPLTEKPVRRVLFADQGGMGKRVRTDDNGSFSTPAASTSFASASTPKHTSASPSSTPSSSQGKSNPTTTITDEVMGLLDGARLDGDAERAVRAALDRHAARARGLEKGRDAAREAMKTAKAQIAELQARVAHLENQKRLDAGARQKMRTDLMKLYRES